MGDTIDLNCDLGEGLGDDAALFPLISSANIACGFHAGDAETIAESCRLAVANGVAIGAHPSYNDREGFGRRAVEAADSTLMAEWDVQIRSVRHAAAEAGGAMAYVKPHGALYNRLQVDDHLAQLFCRVLADGGDAAVLGMPRSALERAAVAQGVAYFTEAFADRAYLPDGSLAPRSLPRALIDDADLVAERAVAIATGRGVLATDGTRIPLRASSLCLHGDTPGAPALAAAVREALAGADVEVGSFA
ncbi:MULTISPECIES: LamB/YcsF family protein [unclassified Leifsonia]|uniref:LamB/YcsF family protein n=1 Tax=unclassified Leifsonia TaxID=2663824 RepID=UPI001F41EC37|nr:MULTISPECIES: 5-oxoprolinase subunit PxpA [unclassified Leifsonia]